MTLTVIFCVCILYNAHYYIKLWGFEQKKRSFCLFSLISSPAVWITLKCFQDMNLCNNIVMLMPYIVYISLLCVSQGFFLNHSFAKPRFIFDFEHIL